MATRKLEVLITGDASQLEKTLGKLSGQASGFGSAMKKAAIPVAAALGGIAVGAKHAIDAASNLGESVNAVNVVFGKASGQILDFSKNAAKEAGLSMRAFNELVTPIGASLQNVGYSADEAAKASIALGKRAADMASVFNVDVKDALGAIQAGLRGEADPLERFGVGLSDAAVKAKALRMGLAESTAELTAADKAQARYALLMEQTNKVAGDFVNTSGGMANQQRIMKAEFENLSASIGEKLLPAVVKVLGVMLDLIEWVSVNWPKLAKIIGPVMEDIRRVVGDAMEDIQEFWDKHGEKILAIASSVFGTIKQVVESAMQIIKGVIDVVLGVISGDWGRVWDGMKAIVTGVFDQILLALGTILPLLGAAALAIGTGIKNAVVDGITGLAGLVWDLIEAISTKITAMDATIKGWGTGVGVAVKDAVVSGITGVATAAWNIITNLGSLILEGMETVKDWGTSIGSAIKAAVPESLVGIGVAAWSVINNIWDAISDRMAMIKGWGTSIGKWIVGALTDGLSAVVGVVDSVIDKIKWIFEHLPSLPSMGNNPTDPFQQGGSGDAHKTGGYDLMGASPVMAPFAAAAAAHGLHVTSGLRLGAITANGTPSDHAIGKALDVADGSSAMAAFFKSLVGNSSVKQAFYDPLGSIFGGAWSSYREGGHSDHVHVATYDRGGWLMPGRTLAINNTGRPERIVGPGGGGGAVYHIHVGTVIGTTLDRAASELYDGIVREDRLRGFRLGNGNYAPSLG